MSEIQEFLFDMVQDEQITQRQYLHISGRRLDNIGRILPRSCVRDLLLVRREIDRMKENSPPPWHDPSTAA